MTFRRLYVSSALNNPGLYLAHRLMVLMRCAEGNPLAYYNFFPGRERIADELLSGWQYPLLFPRHGMSFEREHPSALARLTHSLRDWSYPIGFHSPGYYLWNSLPALALTGVGVLSFRRRPVTAWVCGVVAAPLVLIAIAVPQGQFRYLTDVYVLGFLLIPLMVFESGPLRRIRALRSAPSAGAGALSPSSCSSRD